MRSGLTYNLALNAPSGLISLLTCVLSFLGTNTLQSQVSIQWDSIPRQVIVGDTFQLQATLRFDPECIFQEKWPDLQWSDLEADIEIIKHTSWDSIPHQSLTVLRKSWTLQAFDTAQILFFLEPLPYIYNHIADTANIPSALLSITAPLSTQEDFHDIKDIVRVQTRDWPILPIFIGILILMALAWILWKAKQKPEQVAPIKIEPSLSELELALLKLNALQGDINQPQLYSNMVWVMKTYLNTYVHRNLPGQTSEMTLKILKPLLNAEEWMELSHLLNETDYIKFGGGQSEEQKAIEYLKRVETLIRNVDKRLRPPISETLEAKEV